MLERCPEEEVAKAFSLFDDEGLVSVIFLTYNIEQSFKSIRVA